MFHQPVQFHLRDTGLFPNSKLPVLLYAQSLPLATFFKGRQIKKIFAANNWTNAWDSGVFTYHHYHSTTHEVLGFYKGRTLLQVGGPAGPHILVTAGDVLIIPAGVAHKNLGEEHQIGCIGAYPDGREYDINTGQPGERPATDRTISSVPIPDRDPIYGDREGIPFLWIVQKPAV